MTLLSSFAAVRYKGIHGLSLPRLSQANLITGMNGVGKTALIEAIWLFMGRYYPTLLWNENVQRARNPVRNPVERLSDSVLELHGTERGRDHSVRWTFERGAEFVRPLTVGDKADQVVQLPVVGRIDTYLDGALAKGSIGGMQPTSGGMVMHENPVPPVPRPNCIIEGTLSPATRLRVRAISTWRSGSADDPEAPVIVGGRQRRGESVSRADP